MHGAGAARAGETGENLLEENVGKDSLFNAIGSFKYLYFELYPNIHMYTST